MLRWQRRCCKIEAGGETDRQDTYLEGNSQAADEFQCAGKPVAVVVKAVQQQEEVPEI